MPERLDGFVLTLNAGSSSLMFALYGTGSTEQRVARGSLERIGLQGGSFRADLAGATTDQSLDLPDHAAALMALLDGIQTLLAGATLRAVGHRVVQGGPEHTVPQRITPVLDALRRLVPLAPNAGWSWAPAAATWTPASSSTCSVKKG